MNDSKGIVYEVPLSEINTTDSVNVRTDTNTDNFKESIKELAESIRENGLLQPVVLRGTYGYPPYDVVIGQRRFLAHKELGLKNTKATFTGEITDTEAVVLSLSENLLRREMNHADIARAITKLYEEFGKDERKVQEKLGLSIKAIRSYIQVEAQATPKIKSLIEQGKLSMMDAKRAIIAAQGDDAKADAFVDMLAKMTKYEKIRAVEYGKANPTASVDQIVEKGQTPKIEETIILNLPRKVSKALKDATEQLARDSEEIIMGALTEWLATNNYLSSSQI